MNRRVAGAEDGANRNGRAARLRIPCAAAYFAYQEGAVGVPGCASIDGVAKPVALGVEMVHRCGVLVEKHPPDLRGVAD